MKNFTCLSFFIVACLWTLTLQAQTNTQDSSANQKRSYWQAETGYTSNAVYLGRKDSMRLPYITPSIGYYDASGLFIDGGFSYLAASAINRIDLFYLDGGYLFSRGNFQAQLSATKYFYNSNSTNVKANIKAGLDLYAAYDVGPIQPSLEAGVNFSNVTDYITTAGLEHTFYIGDKVDITPSGFINAGTQNAYNTYYEQRKFAAQKKKARIRNIYYDITASIADAAAFKILDYEFYLPVNYQLHHLTFRIAPTLAVPVNPAVIKYTVRSSPGRQINTVYREELKNSLFFDAGISLVF